MNQSIAQAKALAAYSAQLRKNAEAKRQRRLNEMRRKLIRQMFADRVSWLFVASVIGGAFAIVLIRL